MIIKELTKQQLDEGYQEFVSCDGEFVTYKRGSYDVIRKTDHDTYIVKEPNQFTPDLIFADELEENDIFVFGSNTKGIHGSGSARYARYYLGALQGVGEGLMGRCYAFPTLNADSKNGLHLVQRSWSELSASAWKLSEEAKKHAYLTFYLTKVGCGLAGFTEEYMKQFFVEMPINVIKPRGW